MLLTLRTPEPPEGGFARPPGHPPGAVRTVELPAGRAHLFHPGADAAAVLLELDPVALGAGLPVPWHGPYAAGALMGMALGRLFAPAGPADGDDAPQPVEARVSVLGGPEGETGFARVFGPLGYAVEAVRLPLDAERPREGGSWFHSVALSGRQRPRDVLSHLRVLLPLFDEGRRRWVDDAEAAERWEEGRAWLETHPEREVLERRLLRRAPRTVLHDRRHEAVVAALKESGARRVLDLGCGAGALLARLLEEPRFEEVVGVEVARDALAEAAACLPPGGRVLHGSLAYRDARLAGFDAAAVVEVIEHLDPPQLAAFEGGVWEGARPATVVVTTPNADYNALFEYHRGGRLRHPDHRFEWTRAEFRAWAEGVGARHGYAVRFGAVGPEDERLGPLTQMAVFERLPGAAASSVDPPADGGASAPGPGGGIDLADVAGERTISTRLAGGVRVAEEEAAAALEAMSRFAVDPRWLVYLPPTTPAAEAAPGTETLEHPSAALAYYRGRGAAGVMLQELHGGTRVVAVVCRRPEAARRRFRAAGGETGAVHTSTGRPFFATRAAEEAFLARLRGVLEGGGVWEELATEWVALEGVMGPGVAVMREVNPRLRPPPALYWSVAAAARGALEAALAEAVAGGVDAAPLLARTRERAALAARYAAALRRACRPVLTADALRLAPVRLLASDGAVHAERDPRWHLERLAAACRAAHAADVGADGDRPRRSRGRGGGGRVVGRRPRAGERRRRGPAAGVGRG